MPELPEVETMRRGVAGTAGTRITAVELPRITKRPILVSPPLAQFRRRAVGRRVASVERVGKRVVIVLDDRQRIVMEPRMTGLALVADPPTQEHLRFRLRLAGGKASELLFWDRRGLGSVRLMDEREFAETFGPDRVGPDALALDADELRDRLAASRRAIKVALLDQRAVAGIGNLYASEILHRSRIHPALACQRLRPHDWLRLHKAMLAILEAAIRFEGSTLSDGTYRNALNQSGTYQNHHRVYDRAGEKCTTCGDSVIVRVVQAQRSTFFCPHCQKKSRSKPR
ncbi:MAG TPA: bifunctional DNA-formamidopyrimidine glycosylase/DNA-(apurinic or apyrimidinic site) lyase [Pirellulales bacterium]|nr:bifunctional DNA-formamidopyrimidine glycosylase/DNA-(apurinic or apyrimidinic site) lyase [Pirellulales bacterium]